MRAQIFLFCLLTDYIAGTEHAIWFRHSLEPDIDSIPDWPNIKRYIFDELRTATTGVDISQMYIEGDIPPSLEKKAPHLKHLQLRYIESTDQLEK